jgi:hypothetical protein
MKDESVATRTLESPRFHPFHFRHSSRGHRYIFIVTAFVINHAVILRRSANAIQQTSLSKRCSSIVTHQSSFMLAAGVI